MLECVLFRTAVCMQCYRGPRDTGYPPTVITTAAVPGSTSDPVVRDRHAGGGDYEVGEGDILSTPIICGGMKSVA